MQKEKNLDDMITDEDIKQLNDFYDIKKNVIANIGIENFIDFIRQIIDSSKSFEFVSDDKRKFIDRITPIFVIKLKEFKPNINELNNPKYLNDVSREITNRINSEILKETTRYILDFIKSNKKINDKFDSLDDEIKSLFWTNVYEIRCSIKDNIIYLRYCI